MTEQLEDKAGDEVESDEEDGEDEQEESAVPVKNPSGQECDVFAINDNGDDEEDDGDNSSGKCEQLGGHQCSMLYPVLHHPEQLDAEEEDKEDNKDDKGNSRCVCFELWVRVADQDQVKVSLEKVGEALFFFRAFGITDIISIGACN